MSELAIKTHDEHRLPDIDCPHCVKHPRGLAGKTWRGWGHPRQSPAKPWAIIWPDGAYLVQHRHWLDHLWRSQHSDGHLIFVAEPYDLGHYDLDDLQLLRSQGWRVSLHGMGLHHPYTLRINISAGETEETNEGDLP